MPTGSMSDAIDTSTLADLLRHDALALERIVCDARPCGA
jgi:hypothetical protein